METGTPAEESSFSLLLKEARQLYEDAKELRYTLIDENDQLSAWGVMETLAKAMSTNNAALLKEAIDESTEILDDLMLM